MNNHSDSNDEANEEASTKEIQATFEETFHSLTDEFGEKCQKERIDLAIVIAIHPQHEQPIILLRGHQYDVTALLAAVLKRLKQELLEDLNID